VTDTALEIRAGPANEPARLRKPSSLEKGEQTVAAYFRSEAAELIAAETQPISKADSVVLIGCITQVSYPGGTWRHTVRVNDREVYVDAPERHDLSTEVRVRLPAEALFIFRGKNEVRNSAPGWPAPSLAAGAGALEEISETRSAWSNH
jgi:hypothetical protein